MKHVGKRIPPPEPPSAGPLSEDERARIVVGMVQLARERSQAEAIGMIQPHQERSMATPANPLQSAFDDANSSLALEGLAVDAAQAARQRQVIDGRMTFEEAIAAAIKEATQ